VFAIATTLNLSVAQANADLNQVRPNIPVNTSDVFFVLAPQNPFETTRSARPH